MTRLRLRLSATPLRLGAIVLSTTLLFMAIGFRPWRPPTGTKPPATRRSLWSAPTQACNAKGDAPGGPDGFGGCWPSASSTGVPLGTQLTVVNGDLSISTPGTVIDGKDIRGCVSVTAANVTIRRSKIACSDFYVILKDTTAGAPLTISDSEISCNGTRGTGVGSTGIVATRLNIHDCENGFDIDSSVTVAESYVHDLSQDPEAHSDGAQINPGSNNSFTHNSWVVWNGTSDIISDPTGNSNVTVTRNLFAGGAFSLYCPAQRSSNFQVIDNRFSKILYPTGGAFGPWTDCEKVAVNHGNAWAITLEPLQP